MKLGYLLVGLGAVTVAVGCQKAHDGGDGDEEIVAEEQLPIAGDPCESEGEEIACDDGDGTVSCYRAFDAEGNGSLVWSECVVGACAQGESQPCTANGTSGMQSCEVGEDGAAKWGACQVSGSVSTPLVLAFDNQNVSFTQAEGGFAVDPRMSVATDWVSASTPWLALDRNGNGMIDGGNELFGSATPLGEGFAPHGFVALAELDKNNDARISGSELDALLVWSDADQDRVSDAGEMISAARAGVVEIQLGYTTGNRCDARGNCEMLSARFSFASEGRVREGRVVDVTLKHQ
ncbi:MAG: calcium-binding protein [Polyangiaceae bacterium]|nr:calcium-binding protein [Polyangiaceae bacterium]